MKSAAWRAKGGSAGRFDADIVVLATGHGSRALGLTLGVTVPPFSCERDCVVTGRVAGVDRDLPLLRDADGNVYFEEQVGASGKRFAVQVALTTPLSSSAARA